MFIPILSGPAIHIEQPRTEHIASFDCRGMHEGVPVVDLSEHLRIMDLVFAEGMDEEALLKRESKGVADEVEKMLGAHGGVVTLLVGKGHNGSNAIEAGSFLLQKGYTVHALLMVPLDQCDPLSQQLAVTFESSGGTMEVFHEQPIASGLIVDGLIGTAFKGTARGTLKEMILAANQSNQPILAIDIPSGLNAETGEGEIVIHATRTATMGFPKFGFFMNQGLKEVGQLAIIDLGIPQQTMEKVVPKAYLMTLYEAESYLSRCPILDRAQIEEMIGGAANFENIQNFVDTQLTPLALQEQQTIIFQPNEKPIICLP